VEVPPIMVGAAPKIKETKQYPHIPQNYRDCKTSGLTRMALCAAVKTSKPRRGLKFRSIAEHCAATRNESA
jgi:hypothetical protein